MEWTGEARKSNVALTATTNLLDNKKDQLFWDTLNSNMESSHSVISRNGVSFTVYAAELATFAKNKITLEACVDIFAEGTRSLHNFVASSFFPSREICEV